MLSSIRQAVAYLRANDLETAWREFIRRDNCHPFVQLSKYGFFGVLSVIVHNLVFGGLAWSRVFPHFAAQDYPPSERAAYFALASLGGFLASNTVSYCTNVRWVFESGKHHPVKEFALFTGVASIGFLVGLGCGVWDILIGSGSSWRAGALLVVAAILVNFLCRKFLVFKG